MLVKLRMIAHDKPLQVDFAIPAELLEGERSKNSQFIPNEQFKNDAQCSITLKQKHRLDDVELEGDVSCLIDALCSRCGKEIQYPYQESIFMVCVPKKELPRRGYQPAQDAVDEETQEGLAFFSGEEIDLTAIVREHILLNLPMRYMCHENCKGLCSRCGEDLNINNETHQCQKTSKQNAN